jgi:hypothetical protein
MMFYTARHTAIDSERARLARWALILRGGGDQAARRAGISSIHSGPPKILQCDSKPTHCMSKLICPRCRMSHCIDCLEAECPWVKAFVPKEWSPLLEIIPEVRRYAEALREKQKKGGAA